MREDQPRRQASTAKRRRSAPHDSGGYLVWIAICVAKIAVEQTIMTDFYICGPIVQEVLQGFEDDPITASTPTYS